MPSRGYFTKWEQNENPGLVVTTEIKDAAVRSEYGAKKKTPASQMEGGRWVDLCLVGLVQSVTFVLILIQTNIRIYSYEIDFLLMLGSACLHIVYVDAVACLHIHYVDGMACLHIVQVCLSCNYMIKNTFTDCR